MVPGVLLAAALVTQVGPLVRKGENAPAAVCSAFAVRQAAGLRLVTAAHCLKTNSMHLWFPGLEGNGLAPGKSHWSQVLAFPAMRWRRVPGHDLALVSLTTNVSAWPSGPMPEVGEPVVIYGYPQGLGVRTVACVYQGVVLLAGQPPRVRPSLSCQGLPSGALQGFSGGAVVNAQGQAVGVVVSGIRTHAGWAPGFEPLDSGWQTAGPHRERFWNVNTAVPALSELAWWVDKQGNVDGWKVLGPDGALHSFGPRLPSADRAGSLRP